MNGQRLIRKHFKNISDKDLYGIYDAALKDDSNEAMVIRYLAISEIEYRMEKKMKEIMKALKELGVDGLATSQWVAPDRIAVYVDDEYFGIWDINRKTFVD